MQVLLTVLLGVLAWWLVTDSDIPEDTGRNGESADSPAETPGKCSRQPRPSRHFRRGASKPSRVLRTARKGRAAP